MDLLKGEIYMDCLFLKRPLSAAACLFIKHKLHIKATSIISLVIFGIGIVSEVMDGIMSPDDFRRLAEGASGSQLILIGIAYLIFKRGKQ